ncbi:MAG TPA: ribonuclease P protein component [bacterium]|nr:ribonuclease P protein component [bacterium]HOM27447.1 ribonuclease P protein component [bacterium]
MIKKRIREILKKGKKIETEYFKLYLNKRNDLKIGFLISSKIGKVVKRNKAKRIIREIVRNNFKKGDFILVLKKEIIEKRKIEEVFEKIKNEIYNSIN